MRRCLLAAVAAAAFMAGGCASFTSPARTDSAYGMKAASTADAIRSALLTADKTARAAGRGKVTSPLASVILSEAESAAGGAEATFAGLQPPSRSAQKVRQELLDMGDEAASLLADLRIAARRGHLDRLPSLAEDVPELADKLKEFGDAQ